jgi:hypothetical protein
MEMGSVSTLLKQTAMQHVEISIIRYDNQTDIQIPGWQTHRLGLIQARVSGQTKAGQWVDQPRAQKLGSCRSVIELHPHAAGILLDLEDGRDAAAEDGVERGE